MNEHGAKTSTKQEKALAKELQALLDHAVRDPVKNVALLVKESASGFRWAGASGYADPEGGVAMRPDDQFRSASVGKMVCATAALTLADEDNLELDGRLDLYLPKGVTAGLHDLDGRSYGEELTLRQLLNHTSGLANYFRLPDFQRLLIEEPGKRWEPLEVLEFTKEHAASLFAPGHGWHYSDTGYLLAGLAIEAVTSLPLHDVYRRRVFDPLGMRDTYMVFREPPRGGVPGRSPSHVFFGEADYTSAESLTADWAGGALVTTAEDLDLLVRALANDSVFTSPSTRRAMFGWTRTGEAGVYYGLGVRRFTTGAIDPPGYGEVWGHTGSSKSFALYWPKRDATICGTLNQDMAFGAWSETLPAAGIVPEILAVLQRVSVVPDA